MIVFNVFPGTKSPNHLFTISSGNTVGFITLRTDHNVSKPNNPGASTFPGRMAGTLSDKRSYYFFFSSETLSSVIWKGAGSLNDCELFPSGDFYHALLSMK